MQGGGGGVALPSATTNHQENAEYSKSKKCLCRPNDSYQWFHGLDIEIFSPSSLNVACSWLVFRPVMVLQHVIHKVRTYMYTYSRNHSICPSSEMCDPPPPLPLPQASVSPPPNQRRGEHTRLRVRGWGSPNSDDWKESLVLCLPVM